MENLSQLQSTELNQTRKFSFQDTTATQKIFNLTKRIRAVAGGTAASKTISILIWLIDYSQIKYFTDKISSIVSISYPHLERGAMLDFQNIMKDRGYWDENRWNTTKHQYTFETGNVLEFITMDTYGKAHGPRRDNLFVNECNNLDYKIVDQLIVRTRETIWLDWNPSEEFWFYTELLPKRKEDIDFITLTYLDNEALDATTVADIESHKGNLSWWKVYGLGQLGTIQSRIYKDWQIIDSVPFEARLDRRGLDFGYSNDPTAVVALYYFNGSYILDEEVYRKGLLNKQIADLILNQPRSPEAIVICDSAEPKSIDELKLFGVNALPAQKGKDSIKNGIAFVQGQRISITSRSVNLLQEYRQYLWQTDPKTDRIINIPEPGNDHTMDAVRYAFNSIQAPNSFLTTANVQYHDY